MTIEMLRESLFWCTVINAGLLIVWWLAFTLLHVWIHRWHGRWFNLSVERFDAVHYLGMMLYKLAIFMFNLVPYIALHVVA